MSHISMCMGRWDIVTSMQTWFVILPIPCIFMHTMSTKNYYNFGTINNDNSRHVTIDARGANVADIIRAALAEDVEPNQEEKPVSNTEHFPYLTKKCFDENRVNTVEAEIQSARKGTAEDMWRTLWNNENLGYVEVEYIDATTLYRAIEKWYGKLPYKERNFRDARNKR